MRKKLIALLLMAVFLCGCAAQDAQPAPTAEMETAPSVQTEDAEKALTWSDLHFDRSMELAYATYFSVDYAEGGYALITLRGTERYLVVPEDASLPEQVPQDITVLKQPLNRMYLVASAAMDYFRELDALDHIRLSGTDADGWYIEEAKQAMEAGKILYAGKYSAPDYELILEERCDLAIENTMILHTPEVREQLESCGIPVMMDSSSYEDHPLGRMEWIKLYGVLTGKEAEAEAYFRGMQAQLEPILQQESTGKTAAFFYITSNGAANIRRPNDYIAKSIALAGGNYVFRDLETDGGGQSTMNIQMEAFYAAARDADVLIYNCSTVSDLTSMEDLLAISELLGDFKAVKQGNVWITGKNLYQDTLGIGGLILEMHEIFTAEDISALELEHLTRLQ